MKPNKATLTKTFSGIVYEDKDEVFMCDTLAIAKYYAASKGYDYEVKEHLEFPVIFQAVNEHEIIGECKTIGENT